MSLPLLALLSLSAPQAELGPIIETQVHATSVTIDGADQVQVDVPKFDESRGALLGVRLYLQADMHRGILAENASPDGTATTLEVYGSAGVVVYGEKPFVLDLAQAQFSHVERMDAYDGNLDYQGTSALGLHLQAPTVKRMMDLGMGYEECRDYVAGPSEKSLHLTLQTLDQTQVQAPGAEILVNRILAEATLMVEYLYAPPLDDIVILPEDTKNRVAQEASLRDLYADDRRLGGARAIGTLP